MTKIYEVIADGKKIGITVAKNAHEALAASIAGTSRKTNSKCGFECDYTQIEVRLFHTGCSMEQAKQVLKSLLEKSTLTCEKL